MVFPCRITVACCAPHNLALNLNMPLYDDWGIDDDVDIEVDEDLAAEELRPTGTASQRDTILRRQGNEKKDYLIHFINLVNAFLNV